MCRSTATTITFAAQRWMLRMKRPGGHDEVDVLDRVVGRVGVRLVIEHQQDAGHERDEERRHRGDPEAPRRRPAQAPAVRAHGVQVEEDVAEDERRARAVGASARPPRNDRLLARRRGAPARLSTKRRSAGRGRASAALMPSPSCPAGRPRPRRRRTSPPLARDLPARRARAARALRRPRRRVAKREPWHGTVEALAASASRCSRGACRRSRWRRRPRRRGRRRPMRPGGTKASPGGSVSGSVTRNLLRGRRQHRGLRQPQRCRASRTASARAGRPERGEAEEVAPRHRARGRAASARATARSSSCGPPRRGEGARVPS